MSWRMNLSRSRSMAALLGALMVRGSSEQKKEAACPRGGVPGQRKQRAKSIRRSSFTRGGEAPPVLGL